MSSANGRRAGVSEPPANTYQRNVEAHTNVVLPDVTLARDQNESDSDNDIYMTMQEAREWVRQQPCEHIPDAPRMADPNGGSDQAWEGDVMEGYDFDFGLEQEDEGPQYVHATGPEPHVVHRYDPDAAQAEDQEEDDMSINFNFDQGMDVEELRRKVQELADEANRAAQADKESETAEDGVNPSQQAVLEPLRCVSANVQKSNKNIQVLLKTNSDADIICIQEIYWGHIKNITSSKNADGDEYHNTIGHKNFLCLGAKESSCMAVYINKHWAKSSPQVRENVIKHNDVLVVTLHLPTGQLTFVNAYNDSDTQAAVNTMLDNTDRFLPICFMAGDFNVRHPMWDQNEQQAGVSMRHHHINAGKDIISTLR